MKVSQMLVAGLMLAVMASTAHAWTVVPVPGTFTAQWTDANGVARSSLAVNGEVYVGNTGRYVMHNVTTIMDNIAAINGTHHTYACYSALESCLSVTSAPEATGNYYESGQNVVADFTLTMPAGQSSATLNLSYAERQTFMNPVIISAKTTLTVYAYPTDADLGHLFAYARTLPQFAGAGSVQSIAIPQGQPGAGTYKYILSGDAQWAVGINADDGKLWLYNGSSGFQAYDNWWVYLKDAQSKGF